MIRVFAYWPITLILFLSIISCASTASDSISVTPVSEADQAWAIIHSKIKELSIRIGGKEISELYDITRAESKGHITYRCFGRIEGLGNLPPQPYRFYLEHDFKISAFKPGGISFGDTGIGFDLVKDEHTRAALVTAVRDFNQYLGLTYYEGPFIQVLPDSSYLVSFYSVPRETVEKSWKRGRMFVDPYVSFLLTKDKKVFGVFWGS